MAKSTIERKKPQVNIGTIGQDGLGRTLTAAIVKLFGDLRDNEQLVAGLDAGDNGAPDNTVQVKYETVNRHYAHIDCGDTRAFAKAVTTGTADMDGAILMVSATNDLMDEAREAILVARRVGIRRIVVFLDTSEQIDTPEELELVELEVRDLLSSYDFPGDEIPVIKGSAVAALVGSNRETGESAIRELMAAVEAYIPTPSTAADRPFLMGIEDVFSISGRGTVVTGRVERGIVKVGDEIEIVGIRPTQKSTVIGIEMSRKLLDQAQAGDNIGALIRGVNRDGVERGQVICKPGTVQAEKCFSAEIYVLMTGEGGRHTPFFTNYRPQFYFRTMDVTGTVTLPEGTEMVMPGDNVTVEVELIASIAMEEKLRFTIREGGRTVGAGVVTSVGTGKPTTSVDAELVINRPMDAALKIDDPLFEEMCDRVREAASGQLLRSRSSLTVEEIAAEAGVTRKTPEFLRAVLYLCSSREAIFDAEGVLLDEKGNSKTISNKQLINAMMFDEVADPNSGDIIFGARKKVYPVFSLREDKRYSDGPR